MAITTSSTDVLLPSSTSLGKTEGFRYEALVYRDQLCIAVFQKAGVEKECTDMIALLKNQTESACLQQTRVGDAWHGTPPVSKANIQIEEDYVREKAKAEKDIQDTLTQFHKNKIVAVRVDIAIGPNSEILVGYNANKTTVTTTVGDENVSPMLATLLNNCLFVESSLVTQDSIILQANSLDSLKKDSEGKPMPGTEKDITNTLDAMKKRLETADITCQIERHDYAAIKAAKDTTARQPAPQQVSEPEKVPVVVTPEVQQKPQAS